MAVGLKRTELNESSPELMPFDLQDMEIICVKYKERFVWARVRQIPDSDSNLPETESSKAIGDKHGHIAKLCYVDQCNGKRISGAYWTKHLKTMHGFS